MDPFNGLHGTWEGAACWPVAGQAVAWARGRRASSCSRCPRLLGPPAPCVILQEGLAHLCLVGSTCTLTRAKVEANIPRKRGAAAAGYDKAMESFYEKVRPCVLHRCEVLAAVLGQAGGRPTA